MHNKNKYIYHLCLCLCTVLSLFMCNKHIFPGPFICDWNIFLNTVFSSEHLLVEIICIFEHRVWKRYFLEHHAWNNYFLTLNILFVFLWNRYTLLEHRIYWTDIFCISMSEITEQLFLEQYVWNYWTDILEQFSRENYTSETYKWLERRIWNYWTDIFGTVCLELIGIHLDFFFGILEQTKKAFLVRNKNMLWKCLDRTWFWIDIYTYISEHPICSRYFKYFHLWTHWTVILCVISWNKNIILEHMELLNIYFWNSMSGINWNSPHFLDLY